MATKVRIKNDPMSQVGRDFGGQIGEFVRAVEWYVRPMWIIRMAIPLPHSAEPIPGHPDCILVSPDQAEKIEPAKAVSE